MQSGTWPVRDHRSSVSMHKRHDFSGLKSPSIMMSRNDDVFQWKISLNTLSIDDVND